MQHLQQAWPACSAWAGHISCTSFCPSSWCLSSPAACRSLLLVCLGIERMKHQLGFGDQTMVSWLSCSWSSGGPPPLMLLRLPPPRLLQRWGGFVRGWQVRKVRWWQGRQWRKWRGWRAPSGGIVAGAAGVTGQHCFGVDKSGSCKLGADCLLRGTSALLVVTYLVLFVPVR